MHIRIANLEKLHPATIGYAHSDCQSKKSEAQETIGFVPRKPLEEIIGDANSETIGYMDSVCQ